MARMRTYLRPHKNNAPDALQYTPSFSGADTNLHLFHGPGGTAPSPYDQHAFIDHVVVARSYIGPMDGFAPEPPRDGGVPTGDAGGPPTTGDSAAPSRDGGAALPDGGSGETAAGCGCRTVGGSGSAGAGFLLGLLALLVRRRR